VGAAAIFARYALAAAGPLAVSAARLCIAAAILLALTALRPGERLARSQYVRLGAAGVALAIHFGAWIASLDDTSVAISTLLVSTSPLWNAAYDAAVLRKRFPWTVPVALAAGVAGLVMIVSQRQAPAPHPGHQLLGAALALIGSLAFTAYLILVRDVRTTAGTRSIVTVTYTVAAVVLAASAAFAHQSPPPIGAHLAWGGIIAMALVSQLLGHTAMNAALRWFSSTAVAFSTLLEPVIAAIAALLLFGETLSALSIAGAVVLLGSVASVIWTAPS
jgi:drug/metabolite transporter (DMT)-like permease